MLPQYEIIGFLGRGGMGAVYRGRQVRLDRDVAIKVLPETLTHADNDELKFAERFELEAQAMAKFNHPSIVSVFDFGETSEGQLYFVMEFVEGMDIHRYLRENGGSISQEYALSITAHVLDALEYAHSRGIVHRDIKPANVLLNTEGQVKIADFGLAKILNEGDEHDAPALTMSNVALGTPDFVAPEALEGDSRPDHRADLYAVGVMLYQMLTGRMPRGQFPMPSTLLAELDPRIDEIVQQALQYHPDDRFPSASSMRVALDPVISAPISRLQTIEPKDTPPPKDGDVPRMASGPARKKTGKAWIVYAPVALALFAGLLFLVFGKGAPDSPPPARGTSAPGATQTLTAPAEPGTPSDEAKPSADDRPGSVAASGQTENEPPPPPPPPVAHSGSNSPASTPSDRIAPTSKAAEAAQDTPYENSLGMRFAPVPIIGGPTDGKLILFSLWETRVKDYEAFKLANPEIRQATPPFDQDESHPAVYIDYAKAVAFCEWLTELEKSKGHLEEGQHYRLPSDHEWSCAIGIGHLEDPDATPKSKDKALQNVWPWGETWPPPEGLINAYGAEGLETLPDGKAKQPIPNFSDPFPFTAPVDSLGSNQFGLFHMSGNVMEWTSDWHDETNSRRVARSAAWTNVPGGFFLSSARGFPLESASGNALGVRVVLDLNQKAPMEANPAEVTSIPMGGPDSAKAKAAEPEDQVQETAPPLASIPGLQTRLDGYLAARREQMAELATKYGRGLDSRLDQAADGGDLALATAFSAEKERVSGLVAFLEASPADPIAAGGALPLLPELEALPSDAPEGLVGLRQAWDREAEAILVDLDGKLQQSLQALEVELTRAREFEQAKAVLEYRESLEQKGGEAVAMAGAVVAVPDSAAVPGSGAMATPPSDLASATKEEPFENSLGMKFVPVPGTEVLFCIHEVRYRDYEEYAKAEEGIDVRWKALANNGFEIKAIEDHPVMQVNWDDAQKFCAWLSEKEGRPYRLPTDREWSLAVGIGREEDWRSDTTPETVFKPQDAFPWGKEWPPPAGAGNYSDESRRALAPSDHANAVYLHGYDDGFPTTAPVMSFAPNELGLFDLGGNVWEWCEDWYSVEQKERVLRGGSWDHRAERGALLSSARLRTAPEPRNSRSGFRVVLSVPESGPAAASGPPVPMPQATGSAPPAATGATSPQAPDPALAHAARGTPFENSLGMKFVPIEVGGTQILLSVYETTVDNYRKFIRQERNRDWPQPTYRLRDQQAATMMTWFDAEAFCAWLTEDERKKGIIGDNDAYTLPSLLELQTATGVVQSHDTASGRTTYATKYLWGDEWPIPRVVGNLYGEENRKDPIGSRSPISGYNDGELRIADVGSYEANHFGVHDLIGNAMEFCSNWFGREEESKILFGGSWVTDDEQWLRASFRNRIEPTRRSSANGFRVVLRRAQD